ncbi:MAG: CoA transferase [Phycisphaerales bacterium]|nr:CoA transferase [Phycisphaerales bacterium]
MYNTKNNQLPLDDLLVIDFTNALSGPYCTMMLADNGARVIKIERLVTGDSLRNAAPYDQNGDSLFFFSVNRGKESIALDLKNISDLALIGKIICKADILVENFRPGVMDKLGLGYKAVCKINPNIIYASISGFGHTGPLQHAPGFDTVIQGVSGLMSVTGNINEHPVRVGVPIADISAGMWGYMSIMTALVGYKKHGKGAHVDCSMLDGLFAMLPADIAEYTVNGEIAQRSGNVDPAAAPFGAHETKDRDIIVCCLGEKLWYAFCHAINMPELIKDKRFEDNKDRIKNRLTLRSILINKYKEKTAQEWQTIFTNAGIPNGLILNIQEACEQPQISARNMLIQTGGRKLAGNPMKISAYDDPTVRLPAPTLNQHGAKIRKEFNE